MCRGCLCIVNNVISVACLAMLLLQTHSRRPLCYPDHTRWLLLRNSATAEPMTDVQQSPAARLRNKSLRVSSALQCTQNALQAVFIAIDYLQTLYSRRYNTLANIVQVSVIHSATVCSTGLSIRFDNQLYTRYSRLSTLTTGWMFVYTIQPVVNPVWQQVVSCKRGLRDNRRTFVGWSLPRQQTTTSDELTRLLVVSNTNDT